MMERADRYAQIKPLREDQGLTWREIGERLGISLKTAHDIYVDPTGERKKVRRDASARRHGGQCDNCGAPTTRKATSRCRACHLQAVRLESPAPAPGILWAWDFRTQQWARVLVDLEDWNRFKSERWRLISYGYPATSDANKRYLHRMIFDLEPGACWPDRQRIVIDHINRDPLDNRRANLRLCTQKENCANRGGKFEKAAA